MKKSKRTKTEYSDDRMCYMAGLGLLAVIGIFAPLYYLDIFTLSDISPSCFFHTATGLSCPGCGCTRAVHALFDGRILASLQYNPIVIYFFALYIPYMITNTVAMVRNKIYMCKIRKTGESVDSPVSVDNLPYHGMSYRPIYLYVGITILLIFWVVRLFLEIHYIP